MKKSIVTTMLTAIVATTVFTAFGGAVTYVKAETMEETNELILPDENAPIFSSEGSDYLNVPEINLDEDTTTYIEEHQPNTRAAQYRMWRIESKTSGGTSYGAWRNGPSGRGKATMNASNSNTSNRSVSSSISGDYPIGKGNIGASLGITIGKSQDYTVGYSINIPAGKRQQIIFRPVYKNTKVKQRQYVGGVKTNTTKTATVKTFSHWDYSYKNL